jgi:hypothetical protein
MFAEEMTRAGSTRFARSVTTLHLHWKPKGGAYRRQFGSSARLKMSRSSAA